AGHARAGVVVDLDDEVVEVIVAGQAVAAGIAPQADRLIVVARGGVFAPGILDPNRAHRKERARPHMAVGAPPQPPGAQPAPWGSAVASALVGEDPATPERHRNAQSGRRQPSPAGISGRATNLDQKKRPIART